MSDNRPVRYEEDGRIIYRASGLMVCDKVFAALAMGYSPKANPPWFQEILDEGTRNEPVIRAMFEAETGIQVKDVGKVLEMEVIDGVWIRGSIDGRYADERGVNVLFEAKKIRDSGWTRYQRVGVEFQANYPMQTSVYMHMLADALENEVDMAFVGGHYVQDEKTGEWSITEIAPHMYIDPPVNLRAIKQRVVRLERLISEAETVDDVKCSTKMYPCPMYYLHDDDDEEPPVRPAEQEAIDLAQAFAALDDIIAQQSGAVKIVEDAKKEQMAIKGKVMDWLKRSGQESGDPCKIKFGEGDAATEYDLKYLVSPRKGYYVDPSEQVRVTIRARKLAGQDTGKKAVTKSKTTGRKLPPKPDTTGV